MIIRYVETHVPGLIVFLAVAVFGEYGAVYICLWDVRVTEPWCLVLADWRRVQDLSGVELLMMFLLD